jgi:hypothetical protein
MVTKALAPQEFGDPTAQLFIANVLKKWKKMKKAKLNNG